MNDSYINDSVRADVLMRIVENLDAALYMECTEGTASKFYEIWVRRTPDRMRLFARYGKIGQPGKILVRVVGRAYNDEKSYTHIENLITEKLNKGYVFVCAKKLS